MSSQPACGCPVPVINPPDFGFGERLPLPPAGQPESLPYPADPSHSFGRVLTASADTRQGTSLSTESASGCGCDPRYPRNRQLTPRVSARYRNPGLNFAAAEVAALVRRILYPVPGIWLGPVSVHLPSGNVILQLPTPRGGPYDACPVFTYNSQAAKSSGGRGYGISDLYHPTVVQSGSSAWLTSGTGRVLEYSGVGTGSFGTAPASTRNGLQGKAGGGWIEQQPDGLQWHYLSSGLLDKIVSPSGDEWLIQRNSCLVSATVGPGGRTTTISGDYDSTYTVTQPGGRTTVFGVQNRLVTTVTYPTGVVLHLTYSDHNLLTRFVDGEGNETLLAYDRADRLRRIRTADGHVYEYKYIFPETVYDTDYYVEVTDPANHVTTVVHDCNVVRAVVNPLGQRTTFVWEGTGDSRLQAVVDANNHATTLTYTRLGTGVLALSGIQRPVIGTLSFGYDSSSRCISIEDYDGNVTSLEWDSSGNRTGVVDAENNRFTTTYTSHRQPAGTEDPLHARTTLTYDTAGNAVLLANELNEKTTLTYDSTGDATTVINPLSKVTTYSRDGLGRVTAIKRPIEPGITMTDSFSHNGDSLLESFENGEAEITEYDYTGELQLKTVTNPLGHATTWGWDSRGNLEAVTNAESETTTSVYDSASRKINTINPLGFVSTFTHDNVGNVLTAINPENEKTTFIYDAANRRTDVFPPLNFAVSPTSMCTTLTYFGDGQEKSKSVLPMTPSVVSNFTYTGLGSIKTATDPLGHTTTTGYDKAGRPVSVTNAENETVTTVYDPAGRIKATVTPMGHRTTFNYDAGGRQNEVVNPLGKITTTNYDDANRPTVVIDAESNRVTTTYDKANRIKTVTIGDNEITTTIYDAASRIINVIDAIGGVTTTTFDDANRVKTVTNPAGETTTNNYDAAGRLTSVIPPGSSAYLNTYDKADRRIEAITPLGLCTTTVYDDNGRTEAVVRPALDAMTPGFRTTSVYDPADRIVNVINAENKTTTNNWDEASRLKNVIDPLGHTTTFSYDNANRRTAVTNPEGQTTTTVYNADSEVTQIIDARGKSTFFEYDDAGRRTKTTNAAGDVTTFVYDFAGRQIATVDPEGRTFTTVYDNASRPIATVNPAGNRFTTVYDKLSRVQNTIDPLLHKTTILYDGVGRVTVTYDGEGNATHTHYNSAGLKDRVIDPNGHITTFQYDDDQRPTVTINAEGDQTENVYDKAGRVIAFINEENKRTTFTYDKVDRRLTVENPLHQITTFIYDNAGRLDFRYDARNYYTEYEYDDANRLLSRTYEIDGAITTFAYDAVGNRTMMVDVIGGVRYTSTYSYDDVNRMTVAVDPEGFDIGYSYYKDGQRKTMVDPDSGRFTYTYDSTGRLETILNPFGEKTTLVYDIADRRIGQKLANGVITSLSYDDANRLNDVESRNSSTVLLSSFNFLLDPAGNRTTLTASGSDGILWSYDKTNQLLTERRTLSADTYAHTYTYDPRGNRLTLSDSTDTLTYTCDDANRLETVTDSSGTTTYAYDANGNQLTIEEPSGDITTNTWNGENRLVLVEHPDSTETAYRYNGDGLRVAEDHDGTVTLFLYDGNNRLQETDETGLVEAEFTYIPLPYAEVLSQHRDMESSFYLCDGIRNIRQLTDDTQAITDEYSFDAFGNLRSSTGSSANSQLYKGHLLSYRNDPHAGTDTETSTHFRNQSAQTGRFTSEDPAADDHNLYRLVGNNPVNGEDPSGLDEKEQLPRYNAEKRYGFTEDGRYLVTIAGQPMEPCIICHGRGAFGHYPGLTFTDSFVGGQWYRSGSNEHVIGNASSGFASGATLLVPRLLNGGSVAGKAIWQFVTDPDDRSTDWILDTPLPTDKWEDSIETWVYKDREKDSLITMSGRIGGETTATFGLTEGWSIGLSSVRTARLASAPVLSSQSAGLLAARLTPFGGSVIKIGSPVSTLGSSVVTTSTLGTSVSTGAEIMSGVSIVSFRSAGMLDDVGRASSNSEVAPKSLANIGELAAEHQATLKGVWRGEQPLTALPESVRQQLAGLYSRVASENPAGFAQAAFNEARAKFLLGQGPNPGPSVNEFARRMGIPVFKRN